MTQNNEREAFEKFISTESDLKSRFFGLLYKDGECYRHDDVEIAWRAWQARGKSPISQNEQQEAVGRVIDVFDEGGKLIGYANINYDKVRKGDYLYNSPTKQIPDWWKLVPIDPTQEMQVAGANAAKEGERKFLHRNYIAENVYKAMLNKSPTTSLTSETNTEVGND